MIWTFFRRAACDIAPTLTSHIPRNSRLLVLLQHRSQLWPQKYSVLEMASIQLLLMRLMPIELVRRTPSPGPDPDRRSELAASLNSNTAQIFVRKGSEWKATESLSEVRIRTPHKFHAHPPQHDKIITSIDWAPNSNRIVTASQDRNAYVWQQTPDPDSGALIWKPTLVLLRINRAATHVRWSPKEDKFAVASGARWVLVHSPTT